MSAKKEAKTCLNGPNALSCCRIESLVSVDERGQMVLPKEIRDRANIQAGDKLAVINWEKDGEICCILLMKSDNLTSMIQEFLSPLVGDRGSA